MQITVALDSELLEKAKELTGITDSDGLISEALTALIQRENAKRLALLGGTEPSISAAPRR